jgi:hypothetical protein
MKLKLTSGLDYGEGPAGERVCRGAQMGRPNIIPHNLNHTDAEPVRLRLERLRWVDGDYDQGGAYWGHSNDPKDVSYGNMYCAWGKWTVNMVFVQVFVRATNRADAKVLVRNSIPLARFFH